MKVETKVSQIVIDIPASLATALPSAQTLTTLAMGVGVVVGLMVFSGIANAIEADRRARQQYKLADERNAASAKAWAERQARKAARRLEIEAGTAIGTTEFDGAIHSEIWRDKEAIRIANGWKFTPWVDPRSAKRYPKLTRGRAMDDARYLRRYYLSHFTQERRRYSLEELRSIWRAASVSAVMCIARRAELTRGRAMDEVRYVRRFHLDYLLRDDRKHDRIVSMSRTRTLWRKASKIAEDTFRYTQPRLG